jgi:hypothetical protein
MNAKQSLHQIVLPHFRPNQQITIPKEEHLPDLPNQVRTTPVFPNVPLMTNGAKIRIGNPFNSEVIEEEIFGCVEVTNTSAPTMIGWSSFLMAIRMHGRSPRQLHHQ